MGIPIKWPLVITLCQIFSNEQCERSVQHLYCGNQWWRLSEITDFANVIFHISEDDFDWIYLLSDNQCGCTYSSHLTKLSTQSTEKYQYFCKYNQHNSQTLPITLTSNLPIHGQIFSLIKAYGDPMTALGVVLLRLDLFFCIMKVLLNWPIYILYKFFLVFKISACCHSAGNLYGRDGYTGHSSDAGNVTSHAPVCPSRTDLYSLEVSSKGSYWMTASRDQQINTEGILENCITFL